jgi:FSR family fosmidomycin resistance protein-like MFS transporter
MTKRRLASTVFVPGVTTTGRLSRGLNVRWLGAMLDANPAFIEHAAMIRLPSLGRGAAVNALIGTGHMLSHFYVLCLPPMFIAWARDFDVSFAELGLSVAVMSVATAVLQTPVGFLVDRWGARPFLVGGTLLMSLSVAAMGLATAYWQIVLLALLSGIGNSVIHPADYSILAGSIDRDKIGRSFAFHTFTGNLGMAAAPPVTAALMLVMGWRSALLVVGLAGLPVVLMILWQSRILKDQHGATAAKPKAAAVSGAKLLLTRPMLLFFGFFLLSAMAGAGIQAWLITVLHQTRGIALEAASSALTGYMAGASAGVLLGGWVVDRTPRHLAFAITATIVASGLILLVAMLPMQEALIVAALFFAGLTFGASRTPRDMMLKDAAPRGEIGKVFGFVSSGLPLGQAVTPVPFGFLIDAGRPDLVLVLVAAILLVSLLFIGSARATSQRVPAAVPAE